MPPTQCQVPGPPLVGPTNIVIVRSALPPGLCGYCEDYSDEACQIVTNQRFAETLITVYCFITAEENWCNAYGALYAIIVGYIETGRRTNAGCSPAGLYTNLKYQPHCT